MEHDHRYGEGAPFVPHPSQWPGHQAYPPHHQPPIHDYNGFAYGSVEATYGTAANNAQRAPHHQLHPLIVPPWPSMLAGQVSSAHTPTTNQQSPPTATPTPMSAPVPLASASGHPMARGNPPIPPTPNPRKTLSDAERRKMCIYAEENPTKKQTEIGEMFGVERSTVSKVLRNKEKFLTPEDGSRSPIKKSRSKFPDIDRALANWAKNQEHRGQRLTEEMVKDQARFFFAATSGGSDTQAAINNTAWLEKFKEKNHINGSVSRKTSYGSLDGNSHLKSLSPPATGTPTALSPALSRATSPSAPPMSVSESQDGTRAEGQTTQVSRSIYHSQSNTSLSSAYTAGSPPTFSTGNTSTNSPIFTPDTNEGTTSFFPVQPPAALAVNAPANMQRARSQSYPLPVITDQYSPPITSPQGAASKSATYNSATDTPAPEMPPPATIPSRVDAQPQRSRSEVSRSPSLQQTPAPPSLSPNNSSSSPATTMSLPMTPTALPSQDEARRALEIVMSFFQNQQHGITVEPQDFITIGKLMEKLKLQQHHYQPAHQPLSKAHLPRSLHRIPEHDYAGNERAHAASADA